MSGAPPPAPSRRRKQLDLALQGGGAHGAFTWGVLDRLLEDERLEFAGISGASAGAMNAVALAAGLMEGGRAGAREALRRFWSAVAGATHFGAGGGTLAALFTDAGSLGPSWQVYAEIASRFFSPYQTNPFNFNPLRDILERTIDFERVRACNRTRLFLAATHVRTGDLRVFRQPEISAAVVLASACLPQLFQAVEIDGEAYWDGGYTGNPALLPLIGESPAQDLVLVQLNPTLRDTVPRTASAIIERMNEITFNASLVKELRTIALLQRLIRAEGRPGTMFREPLFRQVTALRVHRIDGQAELAHLGAATKMRTGWTFLSSLHAAGRRAADAWLRAAFAHLGRRSTLDLQKAFGEA